MSDCKRKERKERSAHEYDFIKILQNNKIGFVFCILSRKVTFSTSIKIKIKDKKKL